MKPRSTPLHDGAAPRTPRRTAGVPVFFFATARGGALGDDASAAAAALGAELGRPGKAKRGQGPNASKTAFRAVTTKSAAGVTDTTESWQDATAGGSVVRFREIAYQAGTAQVAVEDSWDPYKLRVDGTPEHTQLGATWTETYTEAKLKGGVATSQARSDGWVVEAVDVPCGPVNGQTFSCLRVRKTADGAAAGKTYLFARCVGKVREEGTQTEELTDYQLK